jgi:hypothetical protein
MGSRQVNDQGCVALGRLLNAESLLYPHSGRHTLSPPQHIVVGKSHKTIG